MTSTFLCLYLTSLSPWRASQNLANSPKSIPWLPSLSAALISALASASAISPPTFLIRLDSSSAEIKPSPSASNNLKAFSDNLRWRRTFNFRAVLYVVEQLKHSSMLWEQFKCSLMWCRTFKSIIHSVYIEPNKFPTFSLLFGLQHPEHFDCSTTLPTRKGLKDNIAEQPLAYHLFQLCLIGASHDDSRKIAPLILIRARRCFLAVNGSEDQKAMRT